MKSNLLLIFSATLVCAQPAPKPVLGTVTEFRSSPLALGVRADDGAVAFLRFGPDTEVVQVPAGEHDFKQAKPAKVTDIMRGDRVMVSFVDGLADARRIVLIPANDIARRNEAERVDWQKRGISGVVAAKDGNEVKLEMRSMLGAQTKVIVVTPKTIVRRYGPDSVKFADAEISSIDQAEIGDQLKTRGHTTEDGKVVAEDIVFGTFRTRLGPILTLDRQERVMRMQDLVTNQPVTIRLVDETQYKKMSFAPAANAADHSPPPAAANMAQIIEQMPAGSIDDLKVGSAVTVTSTRGVQSDRSTAIMVIANVDALLQMAKQHPGDNPMDAIGKMHGGMFGGPGGFSLPAMIP